MSEAAKIIDKLDSLEKKMDQLLDILKVEKEVEEKKPAPIPATTTVTKDYHKITELPPGTLTILQVCEKINENNLSEITNSQKKIGLYGQLLDFKPGGTNRKTGSNFPAKIVLIDSINDELRKFQGVIWSKTQEEKLSKLEGRWLVLSKVYFKIVDEKYIDKEFMLFESGDSTDQFQFHANDCEIKVFKKGG